MCHAMAKGRFVELKFRIGKPPNSGDYFNFIFNRPALRLVTAECLTLVYEIESGN